MHWELKKPKIAWFGVGSNTKKNQICLAKKLRYAKEVGKKCLKLKIGGFWTRTIFAT